MSGISGGNASPEFEKLIQLATFIQTPDYLQRVKELRDLEASSMQALEAANTAMALAAEAQEALDKREAAVKKQEDDIAAKQQAHATRVQALNDALAKAR